MSLSVPPNRQFLQPRLFRRAPFLALALTLATPALAQGAGPLPPELSDGFVSSFLAMFHETPLWVPDAGKGYRTRIRVSLMANTDTQIALRIDERPDGTIRGTAVTVERGGGMWQARDRDVSRFRVTRAQMDELEHLLADATLWQHHPEFWGAGEVCGDGLEMVFERVDANGYRFAEANAPCTATPALLRATRKWTEIAGTPYFRGWLR
jgi:hypothetical protein